jgi:hypothetical protein
LLGLLVCILGLPLAAAETPDLSGTWEMDKDLSEDPMEVMQRQSGHGLQGDGWGGRPGGVGGTPGGMGGPPGGLGDRGQRREVPREEMQQRMRELRASLERLEMTQTDGSLSIVFADGREQTFTTDNKKNRLETRRGKAEIKARWRDGRLVVRTRVDRRLTIETYYLAEGGSLLTIVVETSSEGPVGPLSYKRIYRPVSPHAETVQDSR